MAAFGITMEIRTFKPLLKPMQLQPHQILAVNWIAERDNSFAKGGLAADDCGPGMVRLCCALERYCLPH